MIGFLAPRPAPAARCDCCEPPAAAASYYCFVCDTFDGRLCRPCWIDWHSTHHESEVEDECVRLKSPSGIYVSIDGLRAAAYRPPAYLDLLERWEWDEERAPRDVVDQAALFGELLALLQAVTSRAARLDGDVYGPAEQVVTALLRVLRSPRRRRVWRERLAGVPMILDVVLAAVGDADREAAARAAWTEPAPSVVSDLVCSTCGGHAPYGPPPHDCARCLVAGRHA